MHSSAGHLQDHTRRLRSWGGQAPARRLRTCCCQSCCCRSRCSRPPGCAPAAWPWGATRRLVLYTCPPGGRCLRGNPLGSPAGDSAPVEVALQAGLHEQGSCCGARACGHAASPCVMISQSTTAHTSQSGHRWLDAGSTPAPARTAKAEDVGFWRHSPAPQEHLCIQHIGSLSWGPGTRSQKAAARSPGAIHASVPLMDLRTGWACCLAHNALSVTAPANAQQCRPRRVTGWTTEGQDHQQPGQRAHSWDLCVSAAIATAPQRVSCHRRGPAGTLSMRSAHLPGQHLQSWL